MSRIQIPDVRMSDARVPGQPGRRLLLSALCGLPLLGSSLAPLVASAQTAGWPTRPVRLIAPYPPGGQTDMISRYLAEKLQPALGQNVIVENRAGAQGIVGLEATRNSPPDGYTFVYSNVSNISLNPHMYERLPYDGQKDFAPVTQLGLSVLALVVASSLNLRTLKDFIAYTKANPGKVSFGSFGAGSTSHVYGEMLKAAAGLDVNHVAYKGAGPAVADIMAGHATMGIHDFATILPHIQSGKLLALAVTGPKRDLPRHPGARGAAELGGRHRLLDRLGDRLEGEHHHHEGDHGGHERRPVEPGVEHGRRER